MNRPVRRGRGRIARVQRRAVRLETFAGDRNWPPASVAEIFDLVTIGDGLVGGSATIRYGLINQGVQEFRVQVPAHWKNVEFTGPNIRRKEQSTSDGTNTPVGPSRLQDKAWGGYTLVVTYDYQFDPQGRDARGRGRSCPGRRARDRFGRPSRPPRALKLDAEKRQRPACGAWTNPNWRSQTALITRSVLLAYQYTGTNFAWTCNVTRFEESPCLMPSPTARN